MTSLVSFRPEIAPARLLPASPEPRGYLIDDCETGYAISPLQGLQIKCLAVQLVAMTLGAVLASGSIILLVIAPTNGFLWWMLASGISFLAAVLLMRFATRGLTHRIDIDLMRGEVRELILDRTGGITVLARHPFASLGAVHIDRTPGQAANLCIRFRDRPGRIAITRGDAAELEGLRNRLGRDLMAGSTQM